MGNVSISVKLDTRDINHPFLTTYDVRYLIDKNYNNDSPTEEEYNNAIKTLIKRMYYAGMTSILIDVEEFNRFFAPPKEMTVQEIEKELGYKVKIIGAKENT